MTQQNWNRRDGKGTKPRGKGAGMKNLGRSIANLSHYKQTAAIAVVSLFLSIGAQLMVPQMVQNILDAITRGLVARQITALPPAARTAALAQAQLTPDMVAGMTSAAQRALYWAVVLILVFAVIRGGFAFAQAFMVGKLSQGVAFDFRNELFAKIQRLSFSYHDRNRTGQLMVRATDDVEKLQPLLLAKAC